MLSNLAGHCQQSICACELAILAKALIAYTVMWHASTLYKPTQYL